MDANSLVRLSRLVPHHCGQAGQAQQSAVLSENETRLTACPGQANGTSTDSVLVRLSPYGVSALGQAVRCITTGGPSAGKIAA